MTLTSLTSRMFRFLKDNDFFVKSKHEPRTHVSQDGVSGGKVNVSPARMDEFLACIALDIDNGDHIYLNEQLTPTFRFFLDMDLNKNMTDIGDELLDRIISVVYATMQRLYPEADHDIAVLTREGSANCHIVFTRLLVIEPIAVFLCQAIHRAFKEEFDETEPWYNKNNLSDTLDSKPYGNTLRMVGSSKCKRCNTCSRVAGDICMDCGGRGYQHLGMEYQVSHAYVAGQRSQALLSEITLTTFTMLKSVTLRCDADQEPTPGPDPEEQKAELQALMAAGYYRDESVEINGMLQTKQKKQKRSVEGGGGGGVADKAAGAKRRKKTKEQREVVWTDVPKNTNEQIWAALHAAIAQSHSLYLGTRINSVAMNHPSQPTMYSVRTNSTKCLNLATTSQSHNSETTSFHLFAASRKIVPACGCKCTTTENRRNGVCSQWRPPMTPLAESIAKQLFPLSTFFPTVSHALNDRINSDGQYYATLDRTRVTHAASIESDGVVFTARRPSSYSFVSNSSNRDDKARETQRKLEQDARKLNTFNDIMTRLRAIINTHELQRHRPSYTLQEVESRTKGKQRATRRKSAWAEDGGDDDAIGDF